MLRRGARPMPMAEVLDVLHLLRRAGVAVWLDGGWGVDALLGGQHRDHDDADLVVELASVPTVVAALDGRGYVVVEDHLPTRLVLRSGDGRQIDVHPITFDAAGTGWQAGAAPDGGDCPYPADGFVVGALGGDAAPCLAPAVQLAHHLGYAPRPHDHDDMARLAAAHGLDLPPPYAEG